MTEVKQLSSSQESSDHRRILFVCFADSSHAQSWIGLLKGSEFDVRVFASPVDFGDQYPPIPWHYPTYTVHQPGINRQASKIHWLLPTSRWLRPFVRRIAARYDMPRIWLSRVIQTWKPDIVHSLSFDMGAYLTWEVLKHLPKQARPQWVISSWGSDINLGIEDPETKARLSICLQECDGFIGDCYRDINHARSLGLAEEKLAVGRPIPATGGIDLDELAGLSQDLDRRKVILIPKAYENLTNKTLPILEALRLCEDVIGDYQIHLSMSSQEVQSYVKRLPASIRERCICLPFVPRQDLLRTSGAARVMLSPSLSDGTPIVMLEAMALGALPIMSPLASIKEWITEGENGLLAHALYPDQIANALRRALADDDLCIRAAQINQLTVMERANRKLTGTDLLDFYRSLAGHAQ